MSQQGSGLPEDVMQALAWRAGLKLTEAEMDLVKLSYRPVELFRMRERELGAVPPADIFQPE